MKLGPYTWEELLDTEGFFEAPADLVRVREYLLLMQSGRGSLSATSLFELLLAQYFEPKVYGRLSKTAGHIVYRLSDQLRDGVRKLMYVGNGMSLEEWRQEWTDHLKKGEDDVHVILGEPPELQ